MSLKKIALSALLLAAIATTTAATAAHAVTSPRLGTWYYCQYSNYSGAAQNPGYSRWDRTGGTATLIYTYETFTVPPGYPSTDTYKATWAWKQDLSGTQSKWEFTFNPSGPQCKDTIVYASGVITFDNCTDGHSRICWVG